jgi:hypothetical protein
MTDLVDVPTACVADVESVLQSIATLQGKVIHIYSEEEMVNETTKVKMPAAGVLYEGMRSVAEQGSNQRGVSGELIISIMLLNTQGKAFGSAADTKVATMALLGSIRRGMMGRTSPTGHKWRFIVEAAAAPKAGLVFWVQRWSTPIQNV